MSELTQWHRVGVGSTLAVVEAAMLRQSMSDATDSFFDRHRNALPSWRALLLNTLFQIDNDLPVTGEYNLLLPLHTHYQTYYLTFQTHKAKMDSGVPGRHPTFHPEYDGHNENMKAIARIILPRFFAISHVISLMKENEK